MQNTIRRARAEDLSRIRDLHSGNPGCLPYPASPATALTMVLESAETGRILGVIHAARGEAPFRRHVMERLTVVLHTDLPAIFSVTRLFVAFLEEVRAHYPGVMSVEMAPRGLSPSAMRLYERLGFKVQARAKGSFANGESELPVCMVWINPEFSVTATAAKKASFAIG